MYFCESCNKIFDSDLWCKAKHYQFCNGPLCNSCLKEKLRAVKAGILTNPEVARVAHKVGGNITSFPYEYLKFLSDDDKKIIKKNSGPLCRLKKFDRYIKK